MFLCGRIQDERRSLERTPGGSCPRGTDPSGSNRDRRSLGGRKQYGQNCSLCLRDMQKAVDIGNVEV